MCADTRIVEDPLIMRGEPVFGGTRVPISIVLASLKTGFGFEALRDEYPFLTQELLEAAKTFTSAWRDQPKGGSGVRSYRRLVSSERVPLPPRRK